MKWVVRANETTKKTLDKFETKVSEWVDWFFNVGMVYVYENIILNIINAIMIIIVAILYVPFFIFFTPFSIAVEIYIYTERTKIKPKKTEEQKYDLINK